MSRLLCSSHIHQTVYMDTHVQCSTCLSVPCSRSLARGRSLQDNYLNSDGSSIAIALKVNTSVVSIRCVLPSFQTVVPSLSPLQTRTNRLAHPTQQPFRMGGNKLGREGALSFAEALRVNRSITSVEYVHAPLAAPYHHHTITSAPNRTSWLFAVCVPTISAMMEARR